MRTQPGMLHVMLDYNATLELRYSCERSKGLNNFAHNFCMHLRLVPNCFVLSTGPTASQPPDRA